MDRVRTLGNRRIRRPPRAPYPMTTGRNFHEVLRVIDSLQLTAGHKVATPANWEPGEDVIIVPAVSDDDARKLFPEGWRAPRPYMRFVPQPLS